MPQIGFTYEEMLIKGLVENACRIALMTTDVDAVEMLVKRFEWFHGLGCLLDPTAYREYITSDSGREYEALLRAFLVFRKELEKHAPKLTTENDSALE